MGNGQEWNIGHPRHTFLPGKPNADMYTDDMYLIYLVALSPFGIHMNTSIVDAREKSTVWFII